MKIFFSLPIRFFIFPEKFQADCQFAIYSANYDKPFFARPSKPILLLFFVSLILEIFET